MGGSRAIDTTLGDYPYGTPLANIGGTAIGLYKSGPNTLTLTQANTYTGKTTIGGGTLRIGAAIALPTGTAVTLANAGTALDLGGYMLTVLGLVTTVSGSNITNGTLTMPSGFNLKDFFDYSVVLAGSGSVTASVALLFVARQS